MRNLIHGQIPSKKSLPKPLNFYAECTIESYLWPAHERWIDHMLEYAKEYGFTHINVLGGGCVVDCSETFPRFPKIKRTISESTKIRMERMHSYFKTYKDAGMRITCGFCGPKVADELFELYPEAADVQNGLFFDFIEDSVMEYFREFPEVDCLQMFLWENDFTSDSNQVFPQLYWRAPKRNHLKGDSVYKRDNLCLSQPYFSNVDILTDVLSAYAKGAQKAGKIFSVLTFSHYPWHEAMLIEALKRMDSSIPIHLDHKCQPGDWDLFRPTNNVLEHLNQKPNASMLFDGAGEYWGQCRVPFCMPEEVQFRLQHALNYNENLSEIGMRVMWHYDAVFDNYNEVNFYALSRLVKDPWLPIEQVWDEWAVKRFGAEAAPLMESALKRTFEIAKRNFYILGCWSGNHSLLPSLEYTVAHVMNFGRANYEWNPMDFHFGGVYRELRDRPREYTVQRVLKEKDEALAMAEASMEDIRKVAPLLSDEERERAFYQFGLLLDYTRIVKDHNEAYIRYWVEKTNPAEAAADNREKLLAALDRMAEAVPMVEQKYADTEPLLKAEHLTNYIAEVKAALAELPQQA